MPTPARIVDQMVDLLFCDAQPTRESVILDPGCGQGAFIEGIVRWCQRNRSPIPCIVGIESDPRHFEVARSKFESRRTIEIRKQDFLRTKAGLYDFIVGNPPYVPITALSEEEKAAYRLRFSTAVERFDLYLLFFEQALKSLRAGGRLAFVTPEKFIYVSTAARLRRLLALRDVELIKLIDEATFGELVTYPTISVISNRPPRHRTKVTLRNGDKVRVILPSDGSSWLPVFRPHNSPTSDMRLEDICIRVSCGVATGADSVFVKETASLASGLRAFAYPTIAGRELSPANGSLRRRYSIIVPYSRDGKLLSIEQLGPLKPYLLSPALRSKLLQRTCVARKPWYSFHETPPLSDILRPKLLCKDITAHPNFWTDATGELIPRHSVYYIVPKEPSQLEKLCQYLNSEEVRTWLTAHCQRAANGFLRLQSHVLKEIPVPPELAKPRSLPRQPKFFTRVTRHSDGPVIARNLELF